MGLDGGRSIGMPKSSSERSSNLEFSDLEFVFGGVKFSGGIDMGDGGGERDGDLGGDGNLGGGEGDRGEMVIWGWRVGSEGGGEGEMGGDGDLVGGDCDVEGCGEGDLGVGSLPILPSKESAEREWMGNRYCRGTWTLWRGRSGGWGSLPILPSKESSGREWRGNWYYRGTCTL